MDYKKLINLALKKGVTDVEIYFHKSEGFNCSLFEGEIDAYKVSNSTTLALRGTVNGKMGNASSENIDESNFEFIIDRLIENARIMGSGFVEEIYKGDEKYEEVTKEADDFVNISIETKINTLKTLEKAALNYDPRIAKVDGCGYEERKTQVELFNSKGLNLTRYYQYGIIELSVVAKENESTKSNFDYVIASTYAKLNTGDLVKRVCDNALKALNPQRIETKKYPVILRNDIAASILSTFEKVFSADSAIKGLTFLKDKLNTTIAASKLTIIDNPLYQESVIKKAFDDEGVACKAKKVVENGVFKLFLNNLKTAAKLNTTPTGNGFKSGPTANIGVSSLNLYIENGEVSYEDLIKTTSEGVIITDVAGLHSGVNIVSGDFSIQASGFYVKDGLITHPVSLLVLSGNFYQMLLDVEEIADDLRFSLDQIGSPSLKIKSMSISS